MLFSLQRVIPPLSGSGYETGSSGIVVEQNELKARKQICKA